MRFHFVFHNIGVVFGDGVGDVKVGNDLHLGVIRRVGVASETIVISPLQLKFLLSFSNFHFEISLRSDVVGGSSLFLHFSHQRRCATRNG